MTCVKKNDPSSLLEHLACAFQKLWGLNFCPQNQTNSESHWLWRLIWCHFLLISCWINVSATVILISTWNTTISLCYCKADEVLCSGTHYYQRRLQLIRAWRGISKARGTTDIKLTASVSEHSFQGRWSVHINKDKHDGHCRVDKPLVSFFSRAWK